VLQPVAGWCVAVTAACAGGAAVALKMARAVARGRLAGALMLVGCRGLPLAT